MSKDRNKYKSIYTNLGNNIRKAREKKGLTQEQLAFEIDSTRNYIGCIERAEKYPSISFVYDVAIALDLKIKDLFEN